jgi:hypothetical protein
MAAETGGCVTTAGKDGADAGPDGGARLMAGAAGASGTEAGGIGGGRSLKSWATAGDMQICRHRPARIAFIPVSRPDLPPVLPNNLIGQLFDLKHGEFKPLATFAMPIRQPTHNRSRQHGFETE